MKAKNRKNSIISCSEIVTDLLMNIKILRVMTFYLLAISNQRYKNNPASVFRAFPKSNLKKKK